MRSQYGDISFGIFVGILIGFLFGFWTGLIIEGTRKTDAAIEANVAEWTIDAKTGQREFRFKTPEVQE